MNTLFKLIRQSLMEMTVYIGLHLAYIEMCNFLCIKPKLWKPVKKFSSLFVHPSFLTTLPLRTLLTYSIRACQTEKGFKRDEKSNKGQCSLFFSFLRNCVGYKQNYTNENGYQLSQGNTSWWTWWATDGLSAQCAIYQQPRHLLFCFITDMWIF